MKQVLQHLRRVALLTEREGPSDVQLLESFLVRGDEAAFEALLQRHGPMVLGVCRRVLRNAHDAEDAFQATFLVLARKAASIRSRQVIASWLYGVAYRTAMKALAMNAKRRARERQACEIPRAESFPDEELLARLDHELNRLPDKYRVPLILCELEGRTRKEAARALSVPEGTLSWRLAQAKKLLGKRISRYGTLAVTTLLAESLASARLPPLLRISTAKAVLTAGAVSADVLALTEGVMKVMLISKLKIAMCAGTLMLAAGFGVSGMTYQATAQQPRKETALASSPLADELESIRLEMEALRKALHATRERVLVLEGEVRTLTKTARTSATTTTSSAMGIQPSPVGVLWTAPLSPDPQTTPPAAPVRVELPGGRSQPHRERKSAVTSTPAGTAAGIALPNKAGSSDPLAQQQAAMIERIYKALAGAGTQANAAKDPTTDLLTVAEKALQQLRAKPGDKQAIEALERVLKQYKEQEEPKQIKKP